MTKLRFFAAMCLASSVLCQPNPIADAATPRDTADYPADPKLIVVEFFQHVRAGEAKAAWECWYSAVPQGKDKAYEESQVRNTITQWIANARLEAALEKKLPQVYQEMKTADVMTPTSQQIAKAGFTTFRRLAIVRWGDDEDSALPLELDTNAKPPKWLISLSHYRETTQASVGDAFRTNDAVAKATDQVTKEVLDGKITSADTLATAHMRHLKEQLEKLSKEKK